MLLVMNKLNWEVKSNILLKFTPLLPIFYCSISALGVDFRGEKYGCKITWTKYGEKPSFVIVFCSFSDGASVGAKCHPDGHLSAEQTHTSQSWSRLWCLVRNILLCAFLYLKKICLDCGIQLFACCVCILKKKRHNVNSFFYDVFIIFDAYVQCTCVTMLVLQFVYTDTNRLFFFPPLNV